MSIHHSKSTSIVARSSKPRPRVILYLGERHRSEEEERRRGGTNLFPEVMLSRRQR